MDLRYSEIFENPAKGTYVYGKRTICEIHRDIYDLLVLELHETHTELLNKVISLLEEAFIAGMKMNAKLIEYKCGNDDWADPNMKLEDVRKIRARRVALMKMLREQEEFIRKHKN